jgi:hypothetical protein
LEFQDIRINNSKCPPDYYTTNIGQETLELGKLSLIGMECPVFGRKRQFFGIGLVLQ